MPIIFWDSQCVFRIDHLGKGKIVKGLYYAELYWIKLQKTLHLAKVLLHATAQTSPLPGPNWLNLDPNHWPIHCILKIWSSATFKKALTDQKFESKRSLSPPRRSALQTLFRRAKEVVASLGQVYWANMLKTSSGIVSKPGALFLTIFFTTFSSCLLSIGTSMWTTCIVRRCQPRRAFVWIFLTLLIVLPTSSGAESSSLYSVLKKRKSRAVWMKTVIGARKESYFDVDFFFCFSWK